MCENLRGFPTNLDGNFGDEKKEVAYYEREIEEVMFYFKQTGRKVDTKMIQSFNNIADASDSYTLIGYWRELSFSVFVLKAATHYNRVRLECSTTLGYSILLPKLQAVLWIWDSVHVSHSCSILKLFSRSTPVKL